MKPAKKLCVVKDPDGLYYLCDVLHPWKGHYQKVMLCFSHEVKLRRTDYL